MTWKYELAGLSKFSLDLQDSELHWSVSYDDCGREINTQLRQSLESFCQRGPALERWPFYETWVPLDIIDSVSQAAGQGRPAWAKVLPPQVRELFNLAKSPTDFGRDIQQLLAQGVAVDEPDGCGFTALWWSAYYGEPENTLALLQGGAEPRRIHSGVRGFETILHAAASRGYPSLMERILKEFKVNPNLVNEFGETALYFVNKQAGLRRLTSGAVTSALLSGGADPNHRCQDGQTPLDYAKRAGLSDMERLLVAAGARIQ